MNIRLSSGNADSHSHTVGTDWLHRCHFCKRNFLLCLSDLKQPALPFVVGLLAKPILLASGFDILTAVPAFRDPLSPQGQFILPVESL